MSRKVLILANNACANFKMKTEPHHFSRAVSYLGSPFLVCCIALLRGTKNLVREFSTFATRRKMAFFHHKRCIIDPKISIFGKSPLQIFSSPRAMVVQMSNKWDVEQVVTHLFDFPLHRQCRTGGTSNKCVTK